MRALKTIVAL